MATYTQPYQNLTYQIPDIGQVYTSGGTGANGSISTRNADGSITQVNLADLGFNTLLQQGKVTVDASGYRTYAPGYGNVQVAQAGIDALKAAGIDYSSLPSFSDTQMADLNSLIQAGTLKSTPYGNNISVFKGSTITPGGNLTQTISPINPQGTVLTQDGQVIKQSPSVAQVQANAINEPGNSTIIPSPAPINIPGKSTEAPMGQDLTQRMQALKDAGLTSEQIQGVLKGTGYSGATGNTGANNPITSPYSLQNNVALEAFGKKIQDSIDSLSAGLGGSPSTDILTGLFKQFGVQEATDALNSYNQIIFQQKNTLKALPEAVQHSLENVGVTQDQLTRLIVKESVKPLQALNDAMAQAGAAQDRITNALKFVGLFADAAHQDQAARLEIAKFQIDANLSVYKDMEQQQKDLINLALDNRKTLLSIANDAGNNGAPRNIIDAILQTTDIASAMSLAAGYLQKPDTAPNIFGSASGGYYIYDSVTKTVKQIVAAKPGVDMTAGEKRDSAVSAYIQQLQQTYRSQNPTSYDGRITAENYQEALKRYISGGGTQSNFFASFPQQTYLRQLEIDKLPVAMQPTQITPIKALTTDQLGIVNDAKARLDRAKQLLEPIDQIRSQIIQQSIQQYGFDISPYI